MICLVCCLQEVEATCHECDAKLMVCDECAADMDENYCPNCDKDPDD